jgi:predicted small lipoprotein YifL
MVNRAGLSLAKDTHSAMVREISGSSVVRPQRPHRIAFVVLGTLVLALPLAACGRKGPLDPPPGGYAFEQGTIRTPVSRKGDTPVTAPVKRKEPTYDEEGHPIAPEGDKKHLPGDWLLD